MAQFYVHIGTHKTGSTAIQTVLHRSATTLRRHGLVHLPLPPAARSFQRTQRVDLSAVARARSELEREMRRAGPAPRSGYILSWEGFSGDHDRGYGNASAVAESVHGMVDGHRAVIIVYLRRQDDFVESLYTQGIKKGRSLSFDEYLAGLDRSAFDWALLLERYSAVFGKTQVRPRRYHREFLPDASSLIHDFGTMVGCQEIAAGQVPTARNPSYSRDALELARLANQHLDDRERRLLRRVLQRTSAKPAFESFAFFSPGQRHEFLARYDASNANVARDYFGSDAGPLFPPHDDASTGPAYEGLTPERAAVVAARALIDPDVPASRRPASSIGRRRRSLYERVRRVVNHVLSRRSVWAA